VQSEDWGPYRVEEQLGTGGMGEVYRAYDCRLDRWVALKIIRSEVSGGEEARRRFRREARAAARLSHPIIVQIHDIIEREEGDGIVMELVEGETLGRILKRGSLELDRAVRLGREIAEGLAAAHARGLVHRDLKADNVVITADDHPKILDFGLAKRLDPSDEQSISIEGRVMGTSHAMSPEQAQGFEVDPRSDLFSLGTLLYEMVTGSSPFRRPALAETLTRVCVHRQPPVRKLRPEVPAELSDLIDELLQKKPEDRPQAAQEVALALRQMEPTVSATMHPVSYPTQVDLPRATTTGSRTAAPSAAAVDEEKTTQSLPRGEGTESWWYRTVTLARRPVGWGSALAVIAVATVSVLLLRPASPPAIQVAVSEPQVVDPGQVADLDLVSSGLRVAALQAVLDLEHVHPLAPDRVDEVSGTSKEIAAATAADEVVASRLQCREVRCQVTLSRVAANGSLVATESFEVPTDDLLLLSTTVADWVSRIYGDHRLRSERSRFEVRKRDYEEFLRIREAFLRRPGEGTVEQLLTRIEQVEEGSPRFAPAYLLEADLARNRFLTSRSSRDLERAFAAIEQARALAPADPRPLYDLATVALDSESLDLAEEALEELERVRPGDPRLLALRALVLERRSQPGEALELLRSAVRQRPSVQNLFDLANMENRHGRSQEARDHLRQLLARFPDNFSARKLLAQIELQSGSAEEAARLYEELVQRTPESDLLANLGVAYLLLERYEEAAESFRRVGDQQPGNPFATLNLADALLLVGEEAEARATYRKVIELIDRDPAGGEHWQFLTMKAQAFAHLGEARRAASLAQQALQRAPENSQVAYEAAVAYAVIGDTASALVNVERALEQGFDPRWFRFAWFDELRRLPDFQALLDAHTSGEPSEAAG